MVRMKIHSHGEESMQRNWDLIRMILLDLEEAKGEHRKAEEMSPFPADWVALHMKMMEEGGLIEGHDPGFLSGPPQFFALGLTWKGREFLDSIRTQSVWDKTKGLLKEKGVGLTLDTIKAAVVTVVTQLLKS